MNERINTINEAVASGPYRATWESLETQSVPAWYRDAKFGIFIHHLVCGNAALEEVA